MNSDDNEKDSKEDQENITSQNELSAEIIIGADVKTAQVQPEVQATNNDSTPKVEESVMNKNQGPPGDDYMETKLDLNAAEDNQKEIDEASIPSVATVTVNTNDNITTESSIDVQEKNSNLNSNQISEADSPPEPKLTEKKSSSLYVESEHRVIDGDGTRINKDEDDQSPQTRPMSAGRIRTSVGNTPSTPPVTAMAEDIGSTRNIIGFDDTTENYPERSDSETERIIQKLRDTLASPETEADEGNDDDAHSSGDMFPTAVPDEEMEEARKKNQRRKLEREAKMWDAENLPKRISMKEVIDRKVNEHNQRGVDQANLGQFEAAINSFSKALNLQPQNVTSYVERAEAYMQLCDFRSAYLNFKKAYTLEPHNPDLYDKLALISYLEGQCLFDQRLYSEALEKFSIAADMRPTVPGYHTRAIACLAALGRHQECLALVTRRLESEATANPELYVLRARLHLQFRNATLCYYDVRDTLSLDPYQPQALKLMEEIEATAKTNREQAVGLTLQNKLQEALKRITTAIQTNPSIPEYHIFRGALHRRLQNFNDAIDDYLLAMDKSDHDESDEHYKAAQRQLLLTYNDFAVFCYHKNFYEESIILLNKAIKGEKHEKGLYINRGDCFFKSNNLGFALADYEQALEIDPTCWATKCRVAVVHNELGIHAYQNRRYQEAIQRFTLAIESNGKVGQFYVHRARSSYMMQETQDAREDILISLHLDPNNEEMIPLLSRLFPGRNVKDILHSKLAANARERVQSLMVSQKLPPLTASRTKSASSRPLTAEDGVTNPSTIEEPGSTNNGGSIQSVESQVPVHRVMPKDGDIIREKKKIANELQDIFRFSKSLKYNGPRVKSTLVQQEAEDYQPPERNGYTWKKYT